MRIQLSSKATGQLAGGVMKAPRLCTRGGPRGGKTVLRAPPYAGTTCRRFASQEGPLLYWSSLVGESTWGFHYSNTLSNTRGFFTPFEVGQRYFISFVYYSMPRILLNLDTFDNHILLPSKTQKNNNY